MTQTSSEVEKKRLRNLNNSQIQRLKRRRDEERERLSKEILLDRIKLYIETLGEQLTLEQQKAYLVKLREKDQYYTDEFEGLYDDNFSSEKFNEIMTKFLKTDIRIDYESMTDIKKLLLNQI